MVLAVMQAPFTVIILVKRLLNLSDGLAADCLHWHSNATKHSFPAHELSCYSACQLAGIVWLA